MLLERQPCALIVCDHLPHVIYMYVFLCCGDFGDAHVCQLTIVKCRISRYCKFLTRLNLVEQDLYWVFDVICCLHLVLIPH